MSLYTSFKSSKPLLFGDCWLRELQKIKGMFKVPTYDRLKFDLTKFACALLSSKVRLEKLFFLTKVYDKNLQLHGNYLPNSQIEKKQPGFRYHR